MSRKANRPTIATWWRISSYAIEIEPVPIVSFTDLTVTFWNGVREERNNRESDSYRYFPTWQEAHSFLDKRLRQKLYNAECTVADLRGKVEKISQMTPPSSEVICS